MPSTPFRDERRQSRSGYDSYRPNNPPRTVDSEVPLPINQRAPGWNRLVRDEGGDNSTKPNMPRPTTVRSSSLRSTTNLNSSTLSGPQGREKADTAVTEPRVTKVHSSTPTAATDRSQPQNEHRLESDDVRGEDQISPSDSLHKYISDLLDQSALRYKAEQLKKHLRIAEEEETNLKISYPKFADVLEQARNRADEIKRDLDTVLGRIQEADRIQNAQAEQLPRIMKQLLPVAAPVHENSLLQNEAMLKRLDELESRDRRREAELQSLQQSHENSVTHSDFSRVQRDIQRESTQLSNLQKEVNESRNELQPKIESYDKMLEQHHKFLQQQDETTNKLGTLQKQVDDHRNDLQTKLESHGTVLDRHQTFLDQQTAAIKKSIHQVTEQLNVLAGRINIEDHFKGMENKYNAFMEEANSSIQREVKVNVAATLAARPDPAPRLETQFNNAMREVLAVRTDLAKLTHTIHALDSRYNAISTSQLYKSIAAALSPLGPKVSALENNTNSLAGRITTLEDAKTQTSGENVAINANIEDLNAKLRELTELQHQEANKKAGELQLVENVRRVADDAVAKATVAEQTSNSVQVSQNKLREEFNISQKKMKDDLQSIEQVEKRVDEAVALASAAKDTSITLQRSFDETRDWQQKSNEGRQLLEAIKKRADQAISQASAAKDIAVDLLGSYGELKDECKVWQQDLKDQLSDMSADATSLTRADENQTKASLAQGIKLLDLETLVQGIVTDIRDLKHQQDNYRQTRATQQRASLTVSPVPQNTDPVPVTQTSLQHPTISSTNGYRRLVIQNLASSIDETVLKLKLQAAGVTDIGAINQIIIRGKKVAATNYRFALVGGQNNIIKEIMVKANRKRWCGRTIIIFQPTDTMVYEILKNGKDNLFPHAQNITSPVEENLSVRDSTAASPMVLPSEAEDSDTIEVDTSTPRPTMVESGAYLDGWDAGQERKSKSRPLNRTAVDAGRGSGTSTPIRVSTPSRRKRSIDSETKSSSRPGSKRGRFGS